MRLPGALCRLFPAYCAFLVGVFIRMYLPELKNQRSKYLLLCFSVIGVLVVFLEPKMIEISNGFIVNPFVFLLGLLQGGSIILVLSILIEKSGHAYIFKELGQKSLSIMLFHFLAFKIVNYILIMVYNKPFFYLASKPIIYDVSQCWSLLYLIIGLSLPILVGRLFTKTANKFKHATL